MRSIEHLNVYDLTLEFFLCAGCSKLRIQGAAGGFLFSLAAGNVTSLVFT